MFKCIWVIVNEYCRVCNEVFVSFNNLNDIRLLLIDLFV